MKPVRPSQFGIFLPLLPSVSAQHQRRGPSRSADYFQIPQVHGSAD